MKGRVEGDGIRNKVSCGASLRKKRGESPFFPARDKRKKKKEFGRHQLEK